MCHDCWAEMGAPRGLPPNALDIVTLIHQLYAQPDGDTGGPLHVVLDDFNVDRVEPFRGFEWEPRTWRLAELIAAHLRPLSADQRAAVLAAWEGWIELPGAPTRGTLPVDPIPPLAPAAHED